MKLKLSVPTWNEVFELPECFIFCIRHSRLHWIIFKKHEKVTDNLSIRIYINKTENRIRFEIKGGYYLKLLISETIWKH